MIIFRKEKMHFMLKDLLYHEKKGLRKGDKYHFLIRYSQNDKIVWG
jgi:hypothetical protein